jgi:choline kinase
MGYSSKTKQAAQNPVSLPAPPLPKCKVIILAAGMGSRLGGGVDQLKPLTRLAAGKSILEHQLEAISQYISLDRVIVVVGYHKEKIMEHFPDLLYVYSPNFSVENTSKSLLRALKKCDDDVLWLNGDVVFHSAILKKIFDDPKTGMIVNTGKVDEEGVKYCQDEKGRIVAVSKNIPAHLPPPQGEALGINYCSKRNLDQLTRSLIKCAPKDYFERGIELCIEEGMTVWSIPVDSSLCTEVDFPSDLERANEMIKRWRA